MRTLFSPTVSPATIVVVLLVVTAAAMSVSCDQLAPSSHELSGERCEDPVSAEIRPAPAVEEQTGISNYEMSMFDNKLAIDLSDGAGASLGRVETALDFDISPTTGLLMEWRVTTQLVDGDEVLAQRAYRGRELGKGRIWIEAIHRAADSELIQWTVVGEQEEYVSTTIAVEIEDDSEVPEEERFKGPGGRVVEVLELFDDDGNRIDQSEISGWIDARLGDVFESDEAWQQMIAVSDDEAFWQGADAHLRLCRAASVDPMEKEFTVQRQGLCAMELDGSTLSQRHQAQCESGAEKLTNVLETALAVDDVIGILSDARSITMGLVAGGVVAGTGASLGAVFVGSIVAVVLINKAVDHVVSENSDTVFDAAGFAGSLVTGDRADGEAMADFFKGGGSDDGGGGADDQGGGGGGGGDARSGGDPHFDTFDGLSFDFHGAGEYVLVESVSGDPFQVQVRQEPAEGVCPDVGVNTGAVAMIGGSRVAFYAEEATPLHIDGSPARLPGGVMVFDDGGSIEVDPDEEVGYIVRWPGGEQMVVVAREWNDNGLVNAEMSLPDHRAGQVRGLLGNFNGDPIDDIQPRGEAPLSHPVDWRDLTHVFGESWRVDSDESLFDYFGDDSWSTFVMEGFPERPTLLEDLPADEREDAERICEDAGIENEIAFDGCVLDVACTGSSSLVSSHTDRDPEIGLDLTVPIFLDGWEQQGDQSNGTWNVSDDGSSVFQTVNGDPTFYVSSEEYEDVTIRGTFRVDQGSDDDFIGFVFGYQAPLAERDDDPNTFDTFLLSWKAYDQGLSGDIFGPEGFVISHIKGEIPASDYRSLLWDHQDTDVHRVIDTHFEHGRGWRHHTSYPFELTYTAEEIVIVIGGEEIFRVDAADSPAPHAAGRFGFYNYSQAGVHYGNFQSQPAEEDPTASLEGLEVGVTRPESDYEDFEMDTGDPRLCRDACLEDARCDAFTYRRPTFDGVTAHCWLKDDVPEAVDDAGFISGVR